MPDPEAPPYTRDAHGAIDDIGPDLRFSNARQLTRLTGLVTGLSAVNLTNPVTRITNLVINLINTKQQVISILTNLVTSQRV